MLQGQKWSFPQAPQQSMWLRPETSSSLSGKDREEPQSSQTLVKRTLREVDQFGSQLQHLFSLQPALPKQLN